MTALTLSYLILFLITAIALFFAAHNFFKRSSCYGALVTYLMTVPAGKIHPHQPVTRDATLAKQLYKRLAGLNLPFTIELAVEPIGELIHYYISIPAWQADTVLPMIEQLYPSATLTPSDHDLLHPGHITTTVFYIEQTQPFAIPLEATQADHHTALLTLLSKLSTVGEGVCFQWIIQPANPKLVGEVKATLNQLEQGVYQPSKHIPEDVMLTPKIINGLRNKLDEPLLAVSGRVIVSAPETRREAVIAQINDLRGLRLRPAGRPAQALEGFSERRFESSHQMLLSSSELAILIAPPSPFTRATKLRR